MNSIVNYPEYKAFKRYIKLEAMRGVLSDRAGIYVDTSTGSIAFSTLSLYMGAALVIYLPKSNRFWQLSINTAYNTVLSDFDSFVYSHYGDTNSEIVNRENAFFVYTELINSHLKLRED